MSAVPDRSWPGYLVAGQISLIARLLSTEACGQKSVGKAGPKCLLLVDSTAIHASLASNNRTPYVAKLRLSSPLRDLCEKSDDITSWNKPR
ncbi:hypothetical protein AC579_5613 [Pseudocercospora musae]|uniref:Uncharacterized protein n=1 Tax=Pseudocercospora musae TaxID=113226 RepID=A0A139I160_9PEZI|nr:hypothetical protein AC579_5613 [Pseudocercospora musae]